MCNCKKIINNIVDKLLFLEGKLYMVIGIIIKGGKCIKVSY